jgi:hypothetical protein
MPNVLKGVAALCLLCVTATASSALKPDATKLVAKDPAPGYLVPVPAHAVQVHPRIRAAINALVAAEKELNAAPHDFDGHRADAVKAIDKALEQLNLCMKVK